MASSTKFSYQRLRKLPPGLEEDETEEGVLAVRRRGRRSWLRLDSGARRWRRPRVRVAGLRRLLRRKAKVVGAAVRKVLKRLKEGRPYVGELFAGNYMFMQVSPSPTIAYLEKPYLAGHHHHAIIPPHSTRLSIPRAVS
ncbi:uncharacterized protein [Elaeis guineensis]|uniref:Uncharacterized protein LOC105045312 n=1 Tax=Elaeis guineensis var. tenera TaxID=51953 RepID=A0A6I9R760_ELAGV|nr:uncharacterized protein LOC105045312 [Elaeis guineensis]